MTQNPFASPESHEAPQPGASFGVLPPRTAVVPMLYVFAAVRAVEIPFAFVELGEDMEGALIAYGGLTLVVFIATAVTWSMWMYRATANAIAMGGQAFLGDFTPGWATGCYYVPILNLWKPYQAVRAVHDASNGSQSQLIGAWWGMWIVGNFSARISDRVAESTALAMISTVAMIVAAVLGSRVITAINEAQSSRNRMFSAAA